MIIPVVVESVKSILVDNIELLTPIDMIDEIVFKDENIKLEQEERNRLYTFFM